MTNRANCTHLLTPRRNLPLRLFLAFLLGIPVCRSEVAANEPFALATWIDGELENLVALYKQLHQAPELSFHEEKTAAKLAKLLRECGCEVTEGVGGTGVVALLRNGNGPTLMMRTDMDALPVTEATGREYASKVRVADDRGVAVGVMHACGHDIHMTNVIGAVRGLATARDVWRGTLMVVCQPAEEKGAGAQAMLADGLFARFPRPDFAVALHVASDQPAGKVRYLTGYSLANVDSVDIKIKGRGGHGAQPHQGIDPIVIAARLVVDLQTIVSREVKPTEPAVVTVGSIHAGTKHNIIPSECDLQLTVRSYSPVVRKQLQAAIERKARAAATSAGAPEPDINISEGTPSLYNDPELTERLVAALRPILGDENVGLGEPSMGGEDFSRYGIAGVPICMMSLGSIAPERLTQLQSDGVTPPSLHSPQYYPDPSPTLKTGVTILLAEALELLGR